MKPHVPPPADAGATAGAPLRLRRLGIDTYLHPVAYLRSDSPVCRSEGFESQTRIQVSLKGASVLATLNVVHFDLIGLDEIGLSEAAWNALGGDEGDAVAVEHPPAVASFSTVRAKIYGRPLEPDGAQAIIADLVAGRYSEIETAALITACSGGRLDVAETTALTHAMVSTGKRLHWDAPVVVDKHCVGGLPGNRTTLLVVPIVASCGLLIPKTSSRAITSPAGTADTMETLAPVQLDAERLHTVVEREGGCIVWGGGAVALSPADDMLIRIERPLGLDSDGLLVASVLSKKVAAGSTHVVIDVPVGRTAKVRSTDAALALTARLHAVACVFGLQLRVETSDGRQPVGRGIGPALEAFDVLAVLRNEANAPPDLRERALSLAGSVLELGGKAAPGAGLGLARSVLESGSAWTKFQAICEAQGGMREPPVAAFQHTICARHTGRVVAIDNRCLARVAKLAGAPKAAAAGVSFHAPLGTCVAPGQPLLSIHAQSRGELAYALQFAEAQLNLISLQEL
jgi:thymidine phosphorylase